MSLPIRPGKVTWPRASSRSSHLPIPFGGGGADALAAAAPTLRSASSVPPVGPLLNSQICPAHKGGTKGGDHLPARCRELVGQAGCTLTAVTLYSRQLVTPSVQPEVSSFTAASGKWNAKNTRPGNTSSVRCTPN
jgi:hypothetical protein